MPESQAGQASPEQVIWTATLTLSQNEAELGPLPSSFRPLCYPGHGRLNFLSFF